MRLSAGLESLSGSWLMGVNRAKMVQEALDGRKSVLWHERKQAYFEHRGTCSGQASSLENGTGCRSKGNCRAVPWLGNRPPPLNLAS
jgi:hypothetical protein